jgi:CheY-like chemotaxis protein
MNPAELTILLAEDNPDDVALMRRAMRKANLASPLQVVDDGEKAIDYLAGNGVYADRKTYPLPALFMLDLKMPRKSGLEVLAWLHAQPLLQRLPVVVLTSSAQNTDVDTAYDLGANSYLVKPVSFDGLLDIVRTLCPYWLGLNEKPRLAGA